MTDKQKVFCDEYLKDFNATKAALRAGYSKKTAYSIGAELLKKPEIKNYLEKRMKARQKRTEIGQDRVLEELAKIGFADITDYIDVDGPFIRVKNMDDIPPEKRGAIAGFTDGGFGMGVKLNDKMKALELLGRHLGMWNDKIQVGGLEDEKSKLDDLLKQIRGGD